VTDQEIVDLLKKAGWDGCCTTVSETEFGGSVPLEMPQIRRFVALIEEKAGSSGSR
jgi:hypothetical protein